MLTWARHCILKAPTEEEQLLMEPADLLAYWKNYHDVIKRAEDDPYRHGFVLDNWQKMKSCFDTANEVLALGGNRCLAGEQEVYDPVQKKKLRVDEITEPFHVYAYDEESKQFVIAEAEIPFTKPPSYLIHLMLSNGESIKCTMEHLFLTESGWKPLRVILHDLNQPSIIGDTGFVRIVNGFIFKHDTVWDFTVPKYHNYIAGGVVNHNSGKTTGGAWLVVNCAMSNPKSLIICFSQNAELSVLVQQAAVYKALPQELKTKTLGQNEYISFTSQNGFAGSGFILPNGSRVLFKTYSQFSQNNTVLEGMELGSYEPTSVNLGAWCDEYLGGPELINTLVFRLATRNAKMLLTFTPIDGYTQTVREYLDGATTLEWKKAEALNNIDVPYVQKAKNKDAYVIYLHTKDNPFSGYERVLKEAKAKDAEWIKTRLYGIPTKSITTLFPRFDSKINVVKHDAIPTKNVTRYQIIDPAGRKNWFMCWIAVDESGAWWVYREWPDINVGPWGNWRGNKWTQGEGCKSLGMGIKDYVDLINNSEVGETIFERIIDPRLGQAKYSHERGQSSIIEDLADNGVICHPAPGLHEDDGLQSLQSKMAWINTKPLDAINRPHFYVSERCENIIWALQEYTGAQGPDEQAKDPVDCYDVETEILTKSGWVKFCDLSKLEPVATMDKDGFMEWQVPTEYHERHFSGKLITAKSNSIDFAVTPNHRMLTFKQGKNLKFRLAKDICRQDTFLIVTNGVKDSDDYEIEIAGRKMMVSDWAEFLGWYVAEGSATGTKGGKIQVPGRGYSIYISQSKTANPEKCLRIEALLDRIGFNWAYRGVSYVISNQSLWEILLPLGNSYDKMLPSNFIEFPKCALAKMWEAMVLGDGWRKYENTATYATVSPVLANQVTVIMQLLGLAQGLVNWRMLDSGSRISTTPLYHIPQRKTRKATVTTKDKRMLVNEIDYDGMVYCVTVPNGTLIVRRNMTPLVCGNCLRYAAVSDIYYVDPKDFKHVKRRSGGY